MISLFLIWHMKSFAQTQTHSSLAKRQHNSTHTTWYTPPPNPTHTTWYTPPSQTHPHYLIYTPLPTPLLDIHPPPTLLDIHPPPKPTHTTWYTPPSQPHPHYLIYTPLPTPPTLLDIHPPPNPNYFIYTPLPTPPTLWYTPPSQPNHLIYTPLPTHTIWYTPPSQLHPHYLIYTPLPTPPTLLDIHPPPNSTHTTWYTPPSQPNPHYLIYTPLPTHTIWYTPPSQLPIHTTWYTPPSQLPSRVHPTSPLQTLSGYRNRLLDLIFLLMLPPLLGLELEAVIHSGILRLASWPEDCFPVPGLAWGQEEEEPEVDIQTGSGLLAAWLEWWNLAKDEDADLTVGDSVGVSTLMAGDDSALMRVEACASCERRCAGVASYLCHKASEQLINQSIKMYALHRPVMRKTKTINLVRMMSAVHACKFHFTMPWKHYIILLKSILCACVYVCACMCICIHTCLLDCLLCCNML